MYVAYYVYYTCQHQFTRMVLSQVANDQQHLDVERLDFGRAQGRKDNKTLFI